MAPDRVIRMQMQSLSKLLTISTNNSTATPLATTHWTEVKTNMTPFAPKNASTLTAITKHREYPTPIRTSTAARPASQCAAYTPRSLTPSPKLMADEQILLLFIENDLNYLINMFFQVLW